MRVALLACVLAGCSAASSDLGTAAALQVARATFQPGVMPGDGSGPRVIALNLTHVTIAAGTINEPLLGTLDAGATAVAIGLEGDTGFWILPAGAPDTESPTMPGVSTQLSFSRSLPPGPTRLIARAVDAAGNFGPLFTVPITIVDVVGPAGSLVVSLRWGGRADLDLHVITPDGTELWADTPAGAGGRLDFDSNPQCVFDGRDEENLIWVDAPPPGRYVVKVDTFSLCGDAATHWLVEAVLDGVRLAVATGTSIDADTAGAHQKGAGREAITFDVPAP